MVKRCSVLLVLVSCWSVALSPAVAIGTGVVALMPDGAALVPIEQLVVGSRVLSMHSDGSLCWAKVTKSAVFWTDTPVGMILRHEGPPHTTDHDYEFTTYNLLTQHDQDRILAVSPQQSFYDPVQRKWFQAQQQWLQARQGQPCRLMASNFERVEPATVMYRQLVQPYFVQVYAIEVEHPHVYFIADSNNGVTGPERLILTHNGIPLCAVVAVAAAPAVVSEAALALLVGTSVYAGCVVGSKLRQYFSQPWADERLHKLRKVMAAAPIPATESQLPSSVVTGAQVTTVPNVVTVPQASEEMADVVTEVAIKEMLAQVAMAVHESFVTPWQHASYELPKKETTSFWKKFVAVLMIAPAAYKLLKTFYQHITNAPIALDGSLETINLFCNPAEECQQNNCAQCGVWRLGENAELLSNPVEQILFMQRDGKELKLADLYTCKKCGCVGTGGGSGGPEKDPNNKDKDKDGRLCKNCWLQTCGKQKIERCKPDKLKIDERRILNKNDPKYDHIWKKAEHKLNLLGQSPSEIMVKINRAIKVACIKRQLPTTGEFEIFEQIDGYIICIRGFIADEAVRIGTFFVVE